MDLSQWTRDEPPGLTTNCLRWFQKKVLAAAQDLPSSFATLDEWEGFRGKMLKELPGPVAHGQGLPHRLRPVENRRCVPACREAG